MPTGPVVMLTVEDAGLAGGGGACETTTKRGRWHTVPPRGDHTNSADTHPARSTVEATMDL
jgi:hypothetical protein